MILLGIKPAAECVSFKLANEIHIELNRRGIRFITKYVYDADTKELVLRDLSTNSVGYCPAFSNSELSMLLPNYSAAMRVNHREFGSNLFICDDISDIRNGLKPKDDFYVDEVEAKGNRFLDRLRNEESFVKKLIG